MVACGVEVRWWLVPWALQVALAVGPPLARNLLEKQIFLANSFC